MFQLIRDWVDRHFSDPQILILSFLFIGGFVFIFFLGNMLLPVFASVVIAYLLDGMVARLQSFHIPRFACVIIVFTLFMAALLIAIIGLLPLLSHQIGQLLQQLPSMVAAGQSALMRLPIRILFQRFKLGRS